MLSFNKKDDNMVEIAKESRLANFITKHEYRIYGLEQDNNSPVLFSALDNIINEEQEKTLIGFLATNGISSLMEDIQPNNNKIYIGLRRDLRDNVKLCAALIKTFVYYLEGKMELPIDFKSNNIPSFS